MPSPRHSAAQFRDIDVALAKADIARFKDAGLAPMTVISYERDLRVFFAWSNAAQLTAMPATKETVELYVADMLRRGRKITTLERHLVAIHRSHLAAGFESPRGEGVRNLLAGARRVLCQRPAQKDALTVKDLRSIVETIGYTTPISARDCAVLLFGFASALRRSSLARLRLEDLTFTSHGILAQIDREKQDRTGEGREVAVPRGTYVETCPVLAINRWVKWRGEQNGPLFQAVINGKPTGKAILPNRICQIVQEAGAAVGLDRSRLGAHSLRSGLCTEALENGVNELMVARQLGHVSLETTRIYLRSKDPFRGNAAALVGL
jgi:site-specific recombinase XerD